jgi:predicted Zn-dependent protease
MAELQDVSQESEYYLGRAVAAKVLSLYPVVNDEVLTQYINKVGQVVVAFSDRPETYGGYRFGILDTEELNALAAPGGFIFISKGLLNVLPDEDALAAVLAHEVSHVSERHALKRVSGKELSSALDAAGVVAGALTCNQAIQSASKVLGVVTDKITSILLEKGYSREQEYEADAGSVRILQRAGYEGSGLVTVLNQLDRGAVNQSAGWFKTHPSNESRRIAVKHILPPGAGERSSQAQVQRTRRFLRSVRGQIE